MQQCAENQIKPFNDISKTTVTI